MAVPEVSVGGWLVVCGGWWFCEVPGASFFIFHSFELDYFRQCVAGLWVETCGDQMREVNAECWFLGSVWFSGLFRSYLDISVKVILSESHL